MSERSEKFTEKGMAVADLFVLKRMAFECMWRNLEYARQEKKFEKRKKSGKDAWVKPWMVFGVHHHPWFLWRAADFERPKPFQDHAVVVLVYDSGMTTLVHTEDASIDAAITSVHVCVRPEVETDRDFYSRSSCSLQE